MHTHSFNSDLEFRIFFFDCVCVCVCCIFCNKERLVTAICWLFYERQSHKYAGKCRLRNGWEHCFLNVSHTVYPMPQLWKDNLFLFFFYYIWVFKINSFAQNTNERCRLRKVLRSKCNPIQTLIPCSNLRDELASSWQTLLCLVVKDLVSRHWIHAYFQYF